MQRGKVYDQVLPTSGVPMSDAHIGLSPLEQEWRSCVTAITAAAEILRDYRGLHDSGRDRFVAAIIEESDRLRRTFEQASDRIVIVSPAPTHSSAIPFVGA